MNGQLVLEVFTDKRCCVCKETKPRFEFTAHLRNPDGLNYACRPCTNEARRVSRLKRLDKEREYNSRRWRELSDDERRDRRAKRMLTRERDRATQRRYYQENKDRYTEWHKRWCKDHPEATRLHANRRRAKVLAATVVDFTPAQLAERWAYYGHKCWVCGVEATATDHVKPISKGGAHMLCNLRPICKPCNSSKHNRWPYQPPNVSRG